MARDGGGVSGGGGLALAATSDPLRSATISTNREESGSLDKGGELPICLNDDDGGVAAAAVSANCNATASSTPRAAPPRRPVRMLLIDNYDSYTYNLFQLMSMVNGAQPDVIYNDALPWPELRHKLLVERAWDGVVISPGPGTPDVASDVGVCGPLLAEAVEQQEDPSSPNLRFPPVLGVCLGMQALAHACGAAVSRAPEPVHGRLSLVGHCGEKGSKLFAGIPSSCSSSSSFSSSDDEERLSTPFRVVRYHSLAVDERTLPPCLRATAWTVGGTVAVETRASEGAASAARAAAAAAEAAAASAAAPVLAPSSSLSSPPEQNKQQQQQQGGNATTRVLMALEHASLPLFGVQFHPESVATSFGDALFANFREIVLEERRARLGIEEEEGDEEEAEGKVVEKEAADDVVVLSPVRGPATPGSTAEATRTTVSSSRLPSPFPCPDPTSTLELAWEKVEGCLQSVGGTEGLFLRLFGGGGVGGGRGAAAATATATATATASSPPPSSASLRLLDHGAADVWWLDSATADRGRFSFMGGGPSAGHAGPLWSRATYRLLEGGGGGGTLSVTRRDGDVAKVALPPPSSSSSCSSSSSRSPPSSIFDAIEQQLVACARDPDPELPFGFQGGFVAVLGYELRSECGGGSFVAENDENVDENDNVDDGKSSSSRKKQQQKKKPGFGGGSTGTPDAALVFADRLLAADHRTGDVYVLALYEKKKMKKEKEEEEEDEEERAAASWVSKLSVAVRSLAASGPAPLPPPLASVVAVPTGDASSSSPPPPPPSPSDAGPPRFRVRRGRESYLSDVAACLEALAGGESYELCLTTRIEASTRRSAPPPPALALYRTLREGNPAPYAAFIALGGDERREEAISNYSTSTSTPSSSSPSVAVDNYCGPRICCSSPERFLRGDAWGRLEARPIKGTARRVLAPPASSSSSSSTDEAAARAAAAAEDATVAAALAASEKDRAENLMIVDLLRNDLGRVCEPGSVSVPGLMEVETFATVHQLVSTVVGVARGMTAKTTTKTATTATNATTKAEEGTSWARAVAAEASSPSPRVTSPVSAVRAAFPGGSMTGAPKVRSMSILDGLERGARGIYSGSLGFLSVTGAFDLNIVIRTAVVMPRAAAEAAADEAEEARRMVMMKKKETKNDDSDKAASSRRRVLPPAISIGAGGAVVLQSTPEGEYDEMLLKAGALLTAVGKVSCCASSPSSTSTSTSPVVLVEDDDDDDDDEN